MNKKIDTPFNVKPLGSDLLGQVKQLGNEQLCWLSGYCSGLAEARAEQRSPQSDLSVTASSAVASASSTELQTIVLYASQTGNAEDLARAINQSLSQKGVASELSSLADFKPKQLKQQQIILMVASTHGEGEPPDDAIDFYEFIHSKRAPRLEGVRHAVLALGDSSYEFFCQTGKDFDNVFSQLGSTALTERLDCDLDYQQSADIWINQLVEQIAALSEVSASANGELEPQTSSAAAVAESWSKERPFAATVLQNQKITAAGSVKHINHIELSIEDSGINYLPGDSLGVLAKNNDKVVQEILSLTDNSGEESVSVKQTSRSLKQALTENLEISLINKDFVSQYADLSGSESVAQIAAEGYSDYIKNHQIVDLIKLAPIKLEAQQLVDLLKPIKPRMYSIASSLSSNPDEVHLTVGLLQAENDNGLRFGTASHFLIDELEEDDEVLVFIEHNRHFKLPEKDKPIIMIGPGTGIAPFRAFLQERQEEEASGENWLFFGNPNFNTDFLYQLELQNYLKEGILTNLSVAFSRDQQQKIYVQDRLQENASELWYWLTEKQASLYVCGDMTRMAKDVEAALLDIAQQQGKLSVEQAKSFFKNLKKDKRYQRDVY